VGQGVWAPSWHQYLVRFLATFREFQEVEVVTALGIPH